MSGRWARFSLNGVISLGEQAALLPGLGWTARGRDWMSATPSRRRATVVFAAVFVFVFLPAIVGAVAIAAAADGDAASSAGIDGLAWTNVRDSSGVPLSSYQFATNMGSWIHPEVTIVAMILMLEVVGYIVIVTCAIWLICFALSFQWLDWLRIPLTNVAEGLTHQIATPIMMTTAATLGAFFVAWFAMRGFHAKAAAQVVTMLAVAVLGPMYLQDPLGDVVSSHGLLSQGRNLGISIAAGLNGHVNSSPEAMIDVMGGDLADNFARHPTQEMNFGHITDYRMGCGPAWTEGIRSGDGEKVRTNLRDCGDIAAFNRANNPTIGQLGTGLIFLLSAIPLLAFAVYMSIQVIWAGLDSLYHALRIVFGFAAGGFIYGPTQTALVRDGVDAFVAAGKMVGFTVFLALYEQVLSNLFRQAEGREMSVFVIAAVVEVIAVLQLRRLSAGLTRSNEWIANRFSLAMQGNSSPNSTTATALGMGTARAGSSMSGIGAIAAIAALNTVNTSPLTSWIWGKTKNPLDPYSRLRRAGELATMQLAASRMTIEWQQERALARSVARTALARGERYGGGGPLNHIANANIYDGLGDRDVDSATRHAVMMRMGISAEHEGRISAAWGLLKSNVDANPYEFRPRVLAEAGLRLAAEENRRVGPMAGILRGQAHLVAEAFMNNAPSPNVGAVINHEFANRVAAVWNAPEFVPLREAIADTRSVEEGGWGIPMSEWHKQSKDTMKHVGKMLAKENFERTAQWVNRAEELARAGATPEVAANLGDLQRAMQMADQGEEFEIVTDQLPHGDPWPGHRFGPQPTVQDEDSEVAAERARAIPPMRDPMPGAMP